MLDAFRRQPRVAAAFLLALLLTLGLGGWALYDWLWWETHEDQPVEPWMTVGFVARSWDLDPREIDARAGLPLPVDGRPFTLTEIAEDRGVPVAEIVALVTATVQRMDAEKDAANAARAAARDAGGDAAGDAAGDAGGDAGGAGE